ncbi:MAG: hypothetical protein JNL98_35920 [Bryobacterales bacterium]|nr:hypothetical protein [Bryobacterales bacterium]
MMTLEELRNYNKWIGKSPEHVLKSAIDRGGWTAVFPAAGFDQKCFRWAHRVRNFFNATPHALRRLRPDSAVARWVDRWLPTKTIEIAKVVDVLARTPVWGLPALPSRVKESMALDMRFVYRDPHGRIWIQMAPGGTVYHWNANGKSDPTESTAILVTAIGQQNVPVFKLVSPDGSDGSSEVIIRNPGKMTLGDYDELVHVLDWQVVTTIEHFGSYNYSETAVVGDEAHTLRDVTPHKLDRSGYIFPTPGQTFPATHQGKPIDTCLVFPSPR